MTLVVILSLLLLFSVASMSYAYAFRGNARFENVTEYFRKGWPIFTPFNCTLYLLTQKRARQPIMDLNKFPELKVLQDNWKTIRDEVLALHASNALNATSDATSSSYYDIGFRTFYKYGWRKFYLKWYGYTHKSAQRTCPKTVELLKQVPSVNGAMISVLPPGSKLTRHLDPVACSLRYHLGLSTPENDDCYISIDDIKYSWRDGQALLFDETYLHFAFNNTDKTRLILMCDVERPMNILGRIVNSIYKFLMRMTVVPNTSEDKRGIVNRIFSWLSPTLAKSKKLKETNRPLYLLVKYSVNTLLIVLFLLILAGALSLITSFFN